MIAKVAKEGVWIERAPQEDVHIHVDHGQRVVIALNDKHVYSGGSCCPLALSIEAEKATLQVREGPTSDGVKFYHVPLELVDDLLRKLLATVKGTVA